MKAALPDLPVIVNGGLREPCAILEALAWCDGGREAYHRPFVLAQIHQALRSEASVVPSRGELLERMARYAARELRAARLPASRDTCSAFTLASRVRESTAGC